jgi:hypothetical protein
MAKKRISPTSIFIACEGRNTEPLYFERIAEQVEDDGLLAITIYPDKDTPNPKTDALNLKNTIMIAPNATQSITLTPKEFGRILVCKIESDEVLIETSL